MENNTVQQNIPSRWRKTPLGSLTTKLKTGGTPTSTNKSFYGGDIPFVKIDDMTTSGKYLSATKNFISQEGLKNSSAWLVPKGSILYSIYATVGEVSINSIDVATNQAIMGLVVDEKEVDRDYLFQYLISIKPTLNKHFKETTQKNLTSQIVKELEILIPKSKTEQQKIAEILGTVDEDIAKTQGVIEATEKLKRGLMQQLFTRGIGHTKFKETKIGQIPEVWDILLMAEKIDFQEGPGILAKDFQESGVPLIRLEGINSNSLLNGCNYLDQDLVAKKWAHFKLQKGDILLSSSASLGRVTVVNDEGIGAIVYTGIIRFRPKDASVSSDFIQSFLTSPVFQNQIGSHDTGSTIKHFGPSHLKKMWFVVPKEKEQKEIAEILSAVDEKISINKKLKEKLTLLKKGLMQDLLSGKVRTNI